MLLQNLVNYISLLLFLPTLLVGQVQVKYEQVTTNALPKILHQLKKQKEVSFLYEPETIANIKINTPFDYRADIKTILKKILPPVHLKFKKVGRQNYIIKKAKIKKRYLSSRINRKPSQITTPKKISNKVPPRKIIGQILDENKLPLTGATIYLPDALSGTTTDEAGFFELLIPSGNQSLEISFIGYETNVIEIAQQKRLNLQLNPAKNFLNEIVVNAIGFTHSRDKMGATAAIIDPKLIQQSGEVNLLNALGGKAANVQIARTNGDPGAATNIRIRGANTITGSNIPLIILDGIPISNSTIYGGGNNVTGGRTGGVAQQNRLSDLNPNDIASLQILKGASAAALWGSRAANGVIVMTTKKGTSGKLQINYQTTLSFDKVKERLALQTSWGQGKNGQYSPNAAESWGDYIPERTGQVDEYVQNGTYFEGTDGIRYLPIKEKHSKHIFTEENWKEVIQKGGFSQHNLNVSGGNNRATFFFNLGHLNQDGIIKNADYNRTNLRLNGKIYLTDWLIFSTNANYTHSNSNRIQQSSSTTSLLLGLLRTPPDFDNQTYKGTYYDGVGGVFPNRHRSYRRYLGNRQNPIYNNPSWTAFEQTAASTVNRSIIATDLKIQPVNWMQLTVRGGFDKTGDQRNYFFPIGSSGFRSPGVFAEDLIGEQELNFDVIAKANFQLKQALKGTATIGWNINDRQRTINSQELTGFPATSIQEIHSLNGPISQTTIDNNQQHIRSNRAFAILSTHFYDQFFLTASGGLEATSSIDGTFFYPAMDAAWQFTKAIKQPNWLDFGKLRASFGKVGIQPAPHRFRILAEDQFEYTTYSDPLAVNLFGGGFRVDDDKGNANLRPEIKTEWELGIDTRLLQNKLTISATYYQNWIKDVLFYLDLSPSSGYDTQYDNGGKMSNQGFEARLEYTILNKEKWQLSTYTNFSQNKNKVLDLKGTESIDLTGSSLSSRAVVGYPLGVLVGTGSLTDADGHFILNENGFPQLTPSPVVLGDPNPDWRGSLGISASYKKITLGILLEHAHGGDYSPRTQWVLNRFGTTAETANRVTLSQDLMNYAGKLIPKGTTVRGNLKDFGGGTVLLDETWYRTGIGGGFGDNQAYNFSIKDATFTRLREVALSYTLDTPSFQEKSKLAAIKFTIAARNLFLWDKLQGIDPETNQTGVSNGFGLDYFTNPSTRSFLISMAVSY